MASVSENTALIFDSGKLGDGSPSYKLVYADLFQFNFNTSGTSPAWPSWRYLGLSGNTWINVVSGDSGIGGFFTHVEVKVDVVRYGYNATSTRSAVHKQSLEKKGIYDWTIGQYGGTFTNGRASWWPNTSYPTSGNLYTKQRGSQFGQYIEFHHVFHRDHGSTWDRTNGVLYNNISCPEALRWFTTCSGNSVGDSTQKMTVTRPTWMWYNNNTRSSSYGWLGFVYGGRTLTVKVPLVVNGSGTLYVYFTPRTGSGSQQTLSTYLSGPTNGAVELSGYVNFRPGTYNVSCKFVGNYEWTTNSTIPGVQCGSNSSSVGGILAYSPGEGLGPDNYNPSFTIYNTTPEGQFSTSATKSVGLQIVMNDPGVSKYWLSQMVYNVDLYWNDGTKIGSYIVNDSDKNNLSDHSTFFNTSVQVRNSKRQVDEYVYWVVSGYSVDTTGKTRWGSTRTSGKVNVFWAYVEPSKVTFNSARITSSSGPVFTTNRAQLYHGGTALTFNLQATINGWGDRPGTRNYEFSIDHSSPVKYFGRNASSSTGSVSHTYNYTIPDNWVNTSANFTVYKRLDNTEYLASGNPKSPTLGTNHASGGTISFYEVIGAVSGMIDIRPSILMVSIPCSVTGQGIYDKQSSQKVRYYVEVYDRDTERVVNQYVLGNTTGDITRQVTIDLSSSNFTISEPHLYELRLKADVTELLGNVHTYTFYTTTRQAFLPPRYTLAGESNMLLPPTSDSSLLIRQKASNTYTFRVDYDLILTSSFLTIEYYLASSPTVKRTKTVNIIPSPYGGGSFNGQYTFVNPSELSPSDPMYDPEGLALGSKVTAWITSSWTLPGGTSVYSNSSGKVIYDVTPTRYIYYLTRNIEDEKWMNVLHNTTPTRTDRKSKKIFISTDI